MSTPSSNGFLREEALKYAGAGWPVFPVGRNKKPRIPKEEGGRGYLDATTDEPTISRWWTKSPHDGIATPTGPDWFALDDDTNGEAIAQLEVEHGPLPPTVEVVTPRPGRHVYLGGEGITNSVGSLPAGLDVRGIGGYVLLPPSPHPNGVYEWGVAPDEAAIAPAPAWLLALLKPPQHVHAPPAEDDIPEGSRNATLASLAGTMRRPGFSERAIIAALLIENRDRCKPPLTEADVHKIAKSIARYRPSADPTASLVELSTRLGLTSVGKQVVAVRVFGRGAKAYVSLLLHNGEKVILDPLGHSSTPGKLTLELAAQAGATPSLKMPDVAAMVRLFYLLGEHHEALGVEERAWDLAAQYLRDAVIADVVMSDQSSRWDAFCALQRYDRDPRIDVVLLDGETNVRYVRIQWLGEYLRVRTAPSESTAMLTALERLGWSKAGSEGRIKATQPKIGGTLQWAFYSVPAGWEDQ